MARSLAGGTTAPLNWPVDAVEQLESQEFRETFDRCLAQLSPQMAIAFTLREVEGLSSEEICEVLNVTPNNLWVILHRGRAKLRNSLEAEWFGGRNPESTAGRKGSEAVQWTLARFDRNLPIARSLPYSEYMLNEARKHLYHASYYFEQLYSWAEDLIRAGKAYVDDQSPHDMRVNRGTLTEPGKNSPFRDRGVEDNLHSSSYAGRRSSQWRARSARQD